MTSSYANIRQNMDIRLEIIMFKVLTTSYFCIIFGLQTQMTETKKGFGPGEQDWGYITIQNSSHMFWWLFFVNPQNESDSFNIYEKPLLIWLQGGPGNSGSGFGNFLEVGPLDVDLKPRIYSWVDDYNVLFIDSPIETGFSYDESEQEVELSDKKITEDLIEFMKKFIKIQPKFKRTPIYVLGESYGGKMAANFVWGWWENQQKTNNEINLKGIVLCNSWISSVNFVHALPTYLFNLGQLDNREYMKIQELADSFIDLVNKKNWLEAYNLWYKIIQQSMQIMNHGDLYNILSITAPVVKTRDYSTDHYETSTPDTNGTVDWVTKLKSLMNMEVKQALKLEKFNGTWEIMTWKVYEKLKNDQMKPATFAVSRILNETNLKVFVLTGQLDFIVPSTGTLCWVENLDWNFIEHWKNATKVSFSVNNILEGHVKEYDRFKFFWISRAGHMLPKDNPQAMIAILKDLTTE